MGFKVDLGEAVASALGAAAGIALVASGVGTIGLGAAALAAAGGGAAGSIIYDAVSGHHYNPIYQH